MPDAPPKLRAILIDPVAKAISIFEGETSFEALYPVLGCTAIEEVYLSKQDVLLVDELGLLVDEPGPFFTLVGLPNPMAGRGLLFGMDLQSGEYKSTALTVPDVHALVEFPDIELTGLRHHAGISVVDGVPVGTSEIIAEFRPRSPR